MAQHTRCLVVLDQRVDGAGIKELTMWLTDNCARMGFEPGASGLLLFGLGLVQVRTRAYRINLDGLTTTPQLSPSRYVRMNARI